VYYGRINSHGKRCVTDLAKSGIATICVIVFLDAAVELDKAFR
jgi:hypothetical protein